MPKGPPRTVRMALDLEEQGVRSQQSLDEPTPMSTERTTDSTRTTADTGEPKRAEPLSPRGWSARDEPAPEVARDGGRRSLWERFLYLAGIQGTDKRGGPGG